VIVFGDFSVAMCDCWRVTGFEGGLQSSQREGTGFCLPVALFENGWFYQHEAGYLYNDMDFNGI